MKLSEAIARLERGTIKSEDAEAFALARNIIKQQQRMISDAKDYMFRKEYVSALKALSPDQPLEDL